MRLARHGPPPRTNPAGSAHIVVASTLSQVIIERRDVPLATRSCPGLALLRLGGAPDNLWHESFHALADVLANLDPENFSRVELPVEELDDPLRLPWDLIGNQDHAHWLGLQVGAYLTPEVC